MKIDRLRLLREKRGMSQIRAAKQMGIVRSTYSNYEAGNREPDFETIKKIADFFEVSVDYLLERDDLIDISPSETEHIIRELVKEYDLDLTIPGQKERLADLIKIVLTDHERKQ